MAVEDVPSGGDEATAMTHPVQCVRVHLKVALAVCFSGEGRQADKTDKWTLTCGRTERDNKLEGQTVSSPSRRPNELVVEGVIQVRQCSDLCLLGIYLNLALTTVRAHVDLQRAGTGAALVALWKGADAFIGVGLLGFVLWRGRGCGRLLLTAGAVVHKVRLQVPLTAVPDSTVLAWEDVL